MDEVALVLLLCLLMALQIMDFLVLSHLVEYLALVPDRYCCGEHAKR